ncbi:MAG TPA: GGDEF domain-containing protein [Candidatus Acidoferrales bacterium]
MGAGTTTWSLFYRFRWAIAWLVAGGVFVVFVLWLRGVHHAAEPLLYGYFDLIGSLLALTFAANALVRFRGTHDRVALILAFAFVLSGLIEIIGSFAFYRGASLSYATSVPLAWMLSRNLLALLLCLAVWVDRRMPNSRDLGREVTLMVLLVAGVAYLTSAIYLSGPSDPGIHSGTWLPRPWDLAPATLFLIAAIGFRRRLSTAHSFSDRSIFLMASINVVCHLLASQSSDWLDAPFALAQVLKVSSYAVVLGGMLLDNAQLFDQVRHLAASDPLTGLANYRRFLEVLDIEMRRSRRTQRPFSVLLLDLDGLKRVNDKLGHLVGSRAIGRVAEAIRAVCRLIDTGARYGGDEFAVVLPETDNTDAHYAARRVQQRLRDDAEMPPLTVSVGVATFPADGETVETLLACADRELYKMKARHHARMAGRKVAVPI